MNTSEVKPKKTDHCNFCGRSDSEVMKMIAGPGVAICNECVELCVDIIREDIPNFAVAQLDLKTGMEIGRDG